MKKAKISCILFSLFFSLACMFADWNGLKADYYNGLNFDQLKVVRLDQVIDFAWEGSVDTPASGVINSDQFSVRWTGSVEAVYTQTYTFYTTADDGVRLWVNNQLIIDHWYDQGNTEHSGTISLTAGQKYAIRLDYYENTGGALVKLEWSSASTPRQLIPTARLYAPSTPSAWVISQAYNVGDFVSYNNNNWEAKWWTIGEAPSTADGNPWRLVNQSIYLDNLLEGEQVNYQLLLIRGHVTNTASGITIYGGNEARTWPVVNGNYKATVKLLPGLNTIYLATNLYEVKTINITYDVTSETKLVRMMYAIASDDTTFQAPPGEPNDITSAVKRLKLAGLMMQTTTAELMKNAGYSRKTFQLVRDAQQEVVVELLYLNRTMSEMHAMSDQSIYYYIWGLLSNRADFNDTKFMVTVQPTRYVNGTTYAGIALGGGQLACFGSALMHTYAENISEIQVNFTDNRDVRDYGLQPDFRYRFWENNATGVGASLHGLGHTFTLPHPSNDYDCIMMRGFDRLNRLYLVTEDGQPVTNEGIKWNATNAATLNTYDWIK